MIVLDTNVVSELMRAEPNSSVRAWIGGHAAVSLFTTTITQAEILYGLAILPVGRRRRKLEQAVNAAFHEDFAGRILPFDVPAAHAFALVAAARRQAGKPIAQLDAQIAAIVRSRKFSLATRNVQDFDGCGIGVVNPW